MTIRKSVDKLHEANKKFVKKILKTTMNQSGSVDLGNSKIVPSKMNLNTKFLKKTEPLKISLNKK